jgi:hypothetical protein
VQSGASLRRQPELEVFRKRKKKKEEKREREERDLEHGGSIALLYI